MNKIFIAVLFFLVAATAAKAAPANEGKHYCKPLISDLKGIGLTYNRLEHSLSVYHFVGEALAQL